MKEIRTYNNICELLDELKNMREMAISVLPEPSPLQPVRVGNKIGFVDWENCELECLPIFDDYDRLFTSHYDCICVRQGDNWGVLNGCFRYELPVEYPYSVARQVCKIMNSQYVETRASRKFEYTMKFS